MWYNPKNLHEGDLSVIVVFTEDGIKYSAMTIDGQVLIEGSESDVKDWRSGHMIFRRTYPDGYRGVIVGKEDFSQNPYVRTAVSNYIARHRGEDVPTERKCPFDDERRSK